MIKLTKPGLSAGRAMQMRNLHDSTMVKAIIARGGIPVNEKSLEELAAACNRKQHYVPGIPIPPNKVN